MCQHAARYAGKYKNVLYVCVFIRLYMCLDIAIYAEVVEAATNHFLVDSRCGTRGAQEYMCPHSAICVRILLYMCPKCSYRPHIDTTLYLASAYYYSESVG
jgi:hypothetical protein